MAKLKVVPNMKYILIFLATSHLLVLVVSGFQCTPRSGNLRRVFNEKHHPRQQSFTTALPKSPFIDVHINSKVSRNHNCAVASSSTSLSASIAAVAWVASSLLGGMVGAPIVIKSTKTWYKNIPLPTFTPPNRVFAPVWTTLYIFMGIASWRIKGIVSQPNITTGAIFPPFFSQNIILFSLIHYLMNISWAPVFFGLKMLRAGHILNVALVVTLLPLIAVYYSIDALSGIMLLPYLVWLLLATRLSSGVCKLNPTEVKHGCWYNNAKLQDQIWKLRKEAGRNVGL